MKVTVRHEDRFHQHTDEEIRQLLENRDLVRRL